MNPVLFSVSYAGLWGQDVLGLEEFVRHASKLGYAGVELMGKRPHLSPLDYREERAEELAGLCEEVGLEVACVAAYTNFSGGVESAEVPFGELQVLYVERLARLARALDCGLVRVFTSYERPDLPLAENWRRTVEALQECCDRAAEFDVTIGIQNHHDLAVHSKALLELLGDIDRPNCALMFDPWSPCLRGEEPFETAREMAPHVVYTTLADYVRLPRFQHTASLVNYERVEPDFVRAVPIGEGDIASLEFVRGLRAGGYEGPIAYEMCSPLRGGGSLENLDRCARRFLQWLEENELR
ncbi:MAG: sugar phosphate isomerase/epimerase family protein [Armatimonadota bacterium]|nr:sugar phosphate isomerase/epimerase family protein [Armatimonadota bacterium]